MLLVLSLDSVAEPLIQQLIDEGRLPNIAALRQRGSSRELQEELPGAVYTTLFTGLRLADHGHHFPLEWSANRQAAIPPWKRDGETMERSSLFRRAAARGLKVLVLDPPECGPHEIANGAIASGIEFQARVLLPRWERPISIRAMLGRQAVRVDEVFGLPSETHLLSAARALVQGPGKLPAAWSRLAADGEFELVWLTFAAAHQAGHMLYDDTTWPDSFSSAARSELAGSVRRVYENVDAAIGEALARLPVGASVLMLSSKGMGPNGSRVDLLPAMIDRVLGQETGQQPQPSPLWWLRDCVPASWRARGASLLPDKIAYSIAGRLETMGRDWQRTRAFAPPCDVQGFIRLNLAGREKEGIVSPDEAEAVMEELRQGLISFTDDGGETDGAASIAGIKSSREWAGEGPAIDALPDMIVEWARGRANLIRGVRSPRFGEIKRRGVGTGRSGNHCAGSLITLVAGKKKWKPASDRAGRLEDVASTVCDLLGIPASDLAGTPLFARDV